MRWVFYEKQLYHYMHTDRRQSAGRKLHCAISATVSTDGVALSKLSIILFLYLVENVYVSFGFSMP